MNHITRLLVIPNATSKSLDLLCDLPLRTQGATLNKLDAHHSDYPLPNRPDSHAKWLIEVFL